MYKQAMPLGILTAFLVCACSLAHGPAAPAVEPRYRSAQEDLAQGILERSVAGTERNFAQIYSSWFGAYARSRVRTVEFEDREPQSFGPWEARREFGTSDAASDGSMTEWDDAYYIVHDWSPLGQQVLSLVPGDTVRINGTDVVVAGIFDYPKASYLDEVREVAGAEAVIFQTCYPDSDFNRIAYGR